MKYFFKSATNIIITITFFIFLLQNLLPKITILLGLNKLFLEWNLYYQPLSTIFVHGSLLHILGNMAIFYHYGNMIERSISKLYLLTLYLGGGVLTSLLSYFYVSGSDNFINIVGASGALSVLFGFIAYLVPSERQGLIIIVLLSSSLPFLFGVNVAWYAHFIGFFLGIIFAFFSGFRSRV